VGWLVVSSPDRLRSAGSGESSLSIAPEDAIAQRTLSPRRLKPEVRDVAPDDAVAPEDAIAPEDGAAPDRLVAPEGGGGGAEKAELAQWVILTQSEPPRRGRRYRWAVGRGRVCRRGRCRGC
jgi:hypothetical protein